MHDPDDTFVDPDAFLGGPLPGFSTTRRGETYYAVGDCPQCGAEAQGGQERPGPVEDPSFPHDGGVGDHADADNGPLGGPAAVPPEVAISCRCRCGAEHGVPGASGCGATWYVTAD